MYKIHCFKQTRIFRVKPYRNIKVHRNTKFQVLKNNRTSNVAVGLYHRSPFIYAFLLLWQIRICQLFPVQMLKHFLKNLDFTDIPSYSILHVSVWVMHTSGSTYSSCGSLIWSYFISTFREMNPWHTASSRAMVHGVSIKCELEGLDHCALMDWKVIATFQTILKY